MSEPKKRKRRSFTAEFKAEVVRLVNAGGKSIAQVAADLDLGQTAVRAWVKQAEVDAGQQPAGQGPLTTDERDELRCGGTRRRTRGTRWGTSWSCGTPRRVATSRGGMRTRPAATGCCATRRRARLRSRSRTRTATTSMAT
ncbi:MAG: transposase [Deltaproteobacteria bacterium]|nr:transposase [Deltaproteobacteria bacterium]